MNQQSDVRFFPLSLFSCLKCTFLYPDRAVTNDYLLFYYKPINRLVYKM